MVNLEQSDSVWLEIPSIRCEKVFFAPGRVVMQSRVLMQGKDEMHERFSLPCTLEKGQLLNKLNRKN